MLRQGLHSFCTAGSSRHQSRAHTHSSAACRHVVQQEPTPRHQQQSKLAAVPDSDVEFSFPGKLSKDDLRKVTGSIEDSTDFARGVLDEICGSTADLVRQVVTDQRDVALPKEADLSVEMIMQAMQRAEAAQQQLMSEGKLAEAARQGNRAISSILETHSKLQQLYHKAWRALMEQYGQLAVTPGGKSAQSWLHVACTTHTQCSNPALRA